MCYFEILPHIEDEDKTLCGILVCRREVAENWALLDSKIKKTNPEEGTDRLSRNIGKKLPLLVCNDPEKGSYRQKIMLVTRWNMLASR